LIKPAVPAITRLKSALVEALPRRSKVSDEPMTFYCSDDIAVTAALFVETEEGARMAVISNPLSAMVAAVLLGYNLADEVWAIDTDARQVEQFRKNSKEARVLKASDDLVCFAIPGFVVALETVLG
jgi:hypothetical protein